METNEKEIMIDAIAKLQTQLDKHNPTEMAMRPLIQHFGRLCQVIDSALIEMGWKTELRDELGRLKEKYSLEEVN